MNPIKTLLAAAAAIAAMALPALAQDITINDAYARSMGGMGASGAIFFDIKNASAEGDRLVSAASDAAKMVELHTHKEDANGVMQMLAVPEGFEVPAGGDHLLARGGDHVMLMGLTRELADGDMVTLTLTFEKAGEVTVDVPVDNKR